MLQNLRIGHQLGTGGPLKGKRGVVHTCPLSARCTIVCRPSRKARDRCAGQTRCSFASAVNSSVSPHTVTAQSVTEAVAKATLDKPLIHHALHGLFSSLAWFGLAWVITYYVRKLAKENEAPEVKS